MKMFKRLSWKERAKEPNSSPYYIEEVVKYGAKERAANGGENSYGPIVTEILLSILLSLRAIRTILCFLAGSLIGHLLGSLF